MACAQLGFTSGFLRVAEESVIDFSAAQPPWVGRARCDASSQTFGDCISRFGDTAVCGVTMALFCSSDAGSAA